jgi:uncharacterized protein YydD (DUF2326 family)
MIRRVWSSLEDFREARFEAVGLNIVLANRGEDSDDTESTNGLGKSTLLRIIHFVLGAELKRTSILAHDDLAGVTFGLDLEIDGILYSIGRSTAPADIVLVDTALIARLPLDIEVSDGRAKLSLETWRSALSMLFTPETRRDGADEVFSPSFREIALYLIRLGKEAYSEPTKAYPNQKGPSKRLAVSYLLDMNWEVQRRLHGMLADRDKVTTALKALGDAQDGPSEPSIGDLEAERVVLEKALAARRAEVVGFNLRRDYRELEQRLGLADRALHDLINDNHSDRQLLRYYEESAVDAPLFSRGDPVNILRDAGALFQPEALRGLAEVAAFHHQIYQNRSSFLASEVQRLRAKIRDRDATIDLATADKSQLLSVLNSSGALDTLIQLQRTTSDLDGDLEALKARIDERKRFDRRRDDLTADIGSTRKVLKQDLDDRRVAADEAIELFAEFSSFLYGRPGRLGIDVGPNGYTLTFLIDRQGSDGVDQMVVFCFDLTVATLRARRGARLQTLIHDSSLFADVDPRQFGLALQLGAHVSTREDFQYICCLNEGALPHGHLKDIVLEDYVSLHLTDDGDKGRLLGRRLSPVDLSKRG